MILDMEMVKYNMSCQCVPGHKPFEADPRTGLIEGCAPLTAEDKGWHFTICFFGLHN